MYCNTLNCLIDYTYCLSSHLSFVICLLKSQFNHKALYFKITRTAQTRCLIYLINKLLMVKLMQQQTKTSQLSWVKLFKAENLLSSLNWIKANVLSQMNWSTNYLNAFTINYEATILRTKEWIKCRTNEKYSSLS